MNRFPFPLRSRAVLMDRHDPRLPDELTRTHRNQIEAADVNPNDDTDELPAVQQDIQRPKTRHVLLVGDAVMDGNLGKTLGYMHPTPAAKTDETGPMGFILGMIYGFIGGFILAAILFYHHQ